MRSFEELRQQLAELLGDDILHEDGAPANNAGSGAVAGFTPSTVPGPATIGGTGLVRRKDQEEEDPLRGLHTLRGQ